MDAEDLKFEDESFDSVVNVEASHCYSSRATFFDNVHRVLRLPSLEEKKSNTTFENEHSVGLFFYADFFSAGDIDQIKEELSQKFTILKHENITANVSHAIDLDRPRRRESL